MSLLVHLALIGYAAAAAVFSVWLIRPRAALPLVGRVLLLAGLCAHLGSLAGAWHGRQVLSLLVAATVAGYLALDWLYRLPVAGAFVAPIVVAAMVPAHLISSAAHPAGARSAALTVHVVSSTLGTAALALAFGLALVYLGGERQLKGKHPGRLSARLPSLDAIDRIGWKLVAWGFVLLSAAIATGRLVSPFALGPKQGFALAAWALLALLVQARLVAGWRGRRAALLVVGGFALLAGSLVALLASRGVAPAGGA